MKEKIEKRIEELEKEFQENQKLFNSEMALCDELILIDKQNLNRRAVKELKNILQ